MRGWSSTAWARTPNHATRYATRRAGANVRRRLVSRAGAGVPGTARCGPARGLCRGRAQHLVRVELVHRDRPGRCRVDAQRAENALVEVVVHDLHAVARGGEDVDRARL